MTRALNMRLGIRGLTIQQATAESARRGKSFEELIAEPEQKGGNIMMVQVMFSNAFLQHIMVMEECFGDKTIIPNEFTPRDVYILDIFDKNPERP